MPAAPLLDDATVDAILDGDRAPEGWTTSPLRRRVARPRRTPPPRPSPALAALLTDGMPAALARPSDSSDLAAPAPARPRHGLELGPRRQGRSRHDGRGRQPRRRCRTGVLPGDTDAPVRKVIEVFTPVEFTEDGDPLDHGGKAAPRRTGMIRAKPGDHGDVPADADRRSATTPTSPRPTVSGATTAPRPPTRSPEAEHPQGIQRSRRTRTPMTTRARTTSRAGRDATDPERVETRRRGQLGPPIAAELPSRRRGAGRGWGVTSLRDLLVDAAVRPPTTGIRWPSGRCSPRRRPRRPPERLGALPDGPTPPRSWWP